MVFFNIFIENRMSIDTYRQIENKVRNFVLFRNSIDQGNITLEDLLTTFPFYNTFDVVAMNG